MEAFKKFISFSDGSQTEGVLNSFIQLKERGKITYKNEEVRWHGNHSHSIETISLYRVESPMLFYVVEYEYDSNDRDGFTEKFVFVP